MKEITFSNKYLKFEIPEGGFKEGQKILFMGHLKGMTGGYEFDEEFNDFVWRPNESNVKVDVFRNNLEFFKGIIKAKAHLYVLSNSGTIKHFWSLMKNEMYRFFESEFPTKEEYITYIKKYGIMYEIRMHGDYNANTFEAYTGLNMNKVKKQKDMKFDYIIQNPPYNKSLHLDFLEKGLDLLTEKGRMVIIEPATWLINIRKNGKAKRYDAIKKRIEGHVEKVVIENMNNEFGTGLYVPFATTTIDMSKTFETIELVCCGERKIVKSIYDCNLIGDYETIWSIIEKCHKFGDMMENHIWDKKVKKDFYSAFSEICYTAVAINSSCGSDPDSMVRFTQTKNGDFLNPFFYNGYHNGYEISEAPHKTFQRGHGAIERKAFTDKDAEQVYGTKEELENWKYFIFNNKLPLFLNIVLTFDQHNNSKPHIPWLVDKQYTDEEIGKPLGFTDNEIKFINRTIEKYERNSPWFKRYMCGPDSVSDEEVQNFIDKLNEKYA